MIPHRLRCVHFMHPSKGMNPGFFGRGGHCFDVILSVQSNLWQIKKNHILENRNTIKNNPIS